MSYRKEIMKIYNKEGLRGFTVGYSGLLIRDCFGFGMYFMLYDIFKEKLNI